MYFVFMTSLLRILFIKNPSYFNMMAELQGANHETYPIRTAETAVAMAAA